MSQPRDSGSRRVGKVRIFELAKELGLSSTDLIGLFERLGVEVKNQLSVVDDLIADLIRSVLLRGGSVIPPAAPAIPAPSVLERADTATKVGQTVPIQAAPDNERSAVAWDLAELLKDYRSGELAPPTAKHVLRWVHQFPASDQDVVLSETLHVLRDTYINADKMRFLLEKLVEKIEARQGITFWHTASLLSLQSRSRSQGFMIRAIGEILMDRFGKDLEAGTQGADYVYLDDITCTGNQMGDELCYWLQSAPSTARNLYVLSLVTHESDYFHRNRINAAALAAGINVQWHCRYRYENRRKYSSESQVLFPKSLPATTEFVAWHTSLSEKDREIYLRNGEGSMSYQFFSSPRGRDGLEQAFVSAGARILGFSKSPLWSMRPLGNASLSGIGFGTMACTYRNCPNNAPLALWWGDPDAEEQSPLSRWYPLLKRRSRSD